VTDPLLQESDGELTGSCPIREHAGDGAYIGRCDFATHGFVCPRHGYLKDYPNNDDRDVAVADRRLPDPPPARRRWPFLRAFRGANRMLEITPEMIERATEAVVRVHDEERQAYLRGEVEANVWRPRRYAEAAVRAALDSREQRP
jgi:hypothetical protein